MADHSRSRPQLGSTIRPTVRAVLERLEPTPAFVINRVGDIVAWTLGGQRVFGPIGMLDGSPPNINRFIFTDPRARKSLPDWERAADAAVHQLHRSESSAVASIVTELSDDGGPEFTTRFATDSKESQPFGEVPIQHPTAGLLRLAYETLDLSIVDDQFLVVGLAADDHTRRSFDKLAGHSD